MIIMLFPWQSAVLSAALCTLMTTALSDAKPEIVFRKEAGILHVSPYSEPEMTCPEMPCQDVDCARACAKRHEDCKAFSHNAAQGTCVLSGYLDTDNGTYDAENPAWDTYKTVCPYSKGYVKYTSVRPALCLRLVMKWMNYTEANEMCQRDGAHLARVKTWEVYNLLKQIKLESGMSHWIWVGADSLQAEGEFFWNDGTVLPLTSPLWTDNHHPTTGNKCVETLYDNNAKLTAAKCSRNARGMCQYDIV